MERTDNNCLLIFTLIYSCIQLGLIQLVQYFDKTLPWEWHQDIGRPIVVPLQTKIQINHHLDHPAKVLFCDGNVVAQNLLVVANEYVSVG